MPSAMQKPTPDEVAAYAASLGYQNFDAEHFVDHHIARGWLMRPGIPMRDWRAAARTWQRNRRRWDAERAAAAGNGGGYSPADEAAIADYAKQAAHIIAHKRGFEISSLYRKINDTLGKPACDEVRRRAIDQAAALRRAGKGWVDHTLDNARDILDRISTRRPRRTRARHLTPCMISRVRCIINCDLAGQDPRDLTDRQLLRYRKVGPATLEAIRLLTDPALQFCPHCGHRIEANAQGEHSPGATTEGDMIDPVVVPDPAPETAPEKKLKKVVQRG